MRTMRLSTVPVWGVTVKLQGKVAVVTGAGQGIGRSVALKLAAEGAAVVVNDLDEDAATTVAQEVQDRGGQAMPFAGSVTADGFAEGFVTSAVDAYGGLDIVVNNAGYTWDSVIQRMTDAQWDAMFDVHVKAPFRILRAAQPHFSAWSKAERERGELVTRKVVNITSISGTDGNAGQVNYSAAKAAVVGFTRSLAKEWGRYNVTVNSVGFGMIRTRLTESHEVQDGTIEVEGQQIKVGLPPAHYDALLASIPLGRAGTADEAAGAVYLLCAPESDYVTGEVLICGGGYHF